MGTTTTGLPYPEPTDPVAAGADAIKALALAIDPRLSGPWTPFSPLLYMGGAGVGLVANDSRWCRITPNLIRAEYSFVPGGYLAGAWTLGRPVPGRVKTSGGMTAPYAEPIGQFTGFDVSAGQIFTGFVTPNQNNGTDIAVRTNAVPAAAWSNTVPFAAAAGDSFHCWIEYEPLT